QRLVKNRGKKAAARGESYGRRKPLCPKGPGPSGSSAPRLVRAWVGSYARPSMRFPAEPFRIKVVEPLRRVSRDERERLIRAAGLNIFAVPADSIYVDLLTDSGTSAMSDHQWAGLMVGDESYAGSKNFFHLEDTVRRIFGYRHVIPTHQGRMAENLLFSTLLKPGDIVPNNIHFDTTRANVEHQQADALDLVIDEGLDPQALHPFKGNLDPAKLDRVLSEKGERIPM